jgi:hypothetical protein
MLASSLHSRWVNHHVKRAADLAVVSTSPVAPLHRPPLLSVHAHVKRVHISDYCRASSSRLKTRWSGMPVPWGSQWRSAPSLSEKWTSFLVEVTRLEALRLAGPVLFVGGIGDEDGAADLCGHGLEIVGLRSFKGVVVGRKAVGARGNLEWLSRRVEALGEEAVKLRFFCEKAGITLARASRWT